MTCEIDSKIENNNCMNGKIDAEKCAVASDSEIPLQQKHHIAVIGGGPAGLAFCLQFVDKFEKAKSISANLRVKITLFERSNEIGPGLAYSGRPANKSSLLLNTTKDAMSPIIGKYGDFTEWLAQWEEKENAQKSTDFPPRYMYGLYLKHLHEQLKKQLASSNNDVITVDFQTNKTVTAIEKVQQNNKNNGHHLIVNFVAQGNEMDNNNNEINGQQCIFADQVVLCVGHMPTDTYRQFIGMTKYGHDLESIEQCLKTLKGHESVSIVGTKLSAIDIALLLRAQAHKGPIWMVSRTGLMPAVFSPLSLYAFQQQELSGKKMLNYDNQFGIEQKQLKSIANNEISKWLSIKYLQGLDHQQRKMYQDNPKLERLVLCRIEESASKDKAKKEQHLFISTPALINSDKNDELSMHSSSNGKIFLTKPKCSNFNCIATADQIVESFLHDYQRVEKQLGRSDKNCTSEHNLQTVVERISNMSPMEWLNKGISQCANGPSGWQLAMFSIWEIIPQIWQHLPMDEKKEFMHRWNSLFGAYYAPFPLENAHRIREMFASEQLKVLNDVDTIEWIPSAEKDKNEQFWMSGKIPGPQTHVDCKFTVKADFLLNGTGPGFEAKNLPLIAGLIESGLAEPNQFGGIFVDTKTLRVLPKHSEQSVETEPPNCNELYAVGELTKGHFLTTACMSKVSQQVDKLTTHIMAQLML